MSIERALDLLTCCTWLAVGSLLFALVYAAFFGLLDLKGLLIDKQTRQFSITRLQLVGTTIIVAIIYLQSVVRSPPNEKLPDLDGTLLAAVLSGGIYGIAKINSIFKANTTFSLLETITGNPRRLR